MLNDHWIWRCDRVLPSETEAGHCVVEEVLKQLEEHRWEQHDIFSVQLAMEEAFINAVKHGNRMDKTKKVFVKCRMSPELLRIEIADEGDGFDPTEVPDPTQPEYIERSHGRGLMLMRNFMSRVEYNDMGNCVVLEKSRVKTG
jgi:serine/threonine-protein kinase RsbW